MAKLSPQIFCVHNVSRLRITFSRRRDKILSNMFFQINTKCKMLFIILLHLSLYLSYIVENIPKNWLSYNHIYSIWWGCNALILFTKLQLHSDECIMILGRNHRFVIIDRVKWHLFRKNIQMYGACANLYVFELQFPTNYVPYCFYTFWGLFLVLAGFSTFTTKIIPMWINNF